MAIENDSPLTEGGIARIAALLAEISEAEKRLRVVKKRLRFGALAVIALAAISCAALARRLPAAMEKGAAAFTDSLNADAITLYEELDAPLSEALETYRVAMRKSLIDELRARSEALSKEIGALSSANQHTSPLRRSLVEERLTDRATAEATEGLRQSLPVLKTPERAEAFAAVLRAAIARSAVEVLDARVGDSKRAVEALPGDLRDLLAACDRDSRRSTDEALEALRKRLIEVADREVRR